MSLRERLEGHFKPKIGATGRKAEKTTAQRLGMRKRIASGAIPGIKGDIESPVFLLENKSTIRESFSIKLDILRKITGEALPLGKIPALSFQFTMENGHPRQSGAWVAIPESLFKEHFEVSKE